MEAKILFLPYRVKKQADFLPYRVKNRLKIRLYKVKHPLWLALPFNKLFQEHILSIEDGIRKFMNPIAKNQDTGRTTQHQV